MWHEATLVMLFEKWEDGVFHQLTVTGMTAAASSTPLRPTPLRWGERAKVTGQENCFSSAHQAREGSLDLYPWETV